MSYNDDNDRSTEVDWNKAFQDRFTDIEDYTIRNYIDGQPHFLLDPKNKFDQLCRQVRRQPILIYMFVVCLFVWVNMTYLCLFICLGCPS